MIRDLFLASHCFPTDWITIICVWGIRRNLSVYHIIVEVQVEQTRCPYLYFVMKALSRLKANVVGVVVYEAD